VSEERVSDEVRALKWSREGQRERDGGGKERREEERESKQCAVVVVVELCGWPYEARS